MMTTSKSNKKNGSGRVVLLGGTLALVSLLVTNTVFEGSASIQDSMAWTKTTKIITTAQTMTLGTSSRYDLAHSQSYGFFDDIEEHTWKMMQERVKQRVNHKWPDKPWAWQDEAPVWYQNNYEPDFVCVHERRVGGMGDGPKWVCDPHRLIRVNKERKEQGLPGCLIYSVGSAGRYEFEDGLLDIIGNGTCEFHIFDPRNFSREGDSERGFFFHEWGIVGEHQPESENAMFPNKKTFTQTLTDLGHLNRTIDIFKVDCEACEWHAYEDWLQYDLRQILVETHSVKNNSKHYFDSVQAANFLLFHKEFNAISGAHGVEWGYVKVHPDFFL